MFKKRPTTNFFGSAVKNQRIARNISLNDFAKLLEYDPGNWHKVESGKLKPPGHLVEKSSILLGYSHLGIERVKQLARRDYLPEELW